MANFFDQFDEPKKNFFDQFDEPKKAEGPSKVAEKRSDEPPDLFVGPATAIAKGVGSGVKGFFERVGQAGRGEISPIGPMLEGASLGIASPVRLGLGSVTHAPKPMPRVANTLEELQDAATAAVTRPTGAVVPQAEAGETLRQSVRPIIRPEPPPPAPPKSVDDWLAQAGPVKERGPAIDDWIGGVKTARGDEWVAGLTPPPKPAAPTTPWPSVKGPAVEAPAAETPLRAKMIAQGRILDEHVAGSVVEAAYGRTASDLSSLSLLRRTASPEAWSKIQGASLARLGQTGELGKEVGFDAVQMLQRYKDLPDAGKGILFGQPVTVAGQKLQAGLRPHLDSLVADMERLGAGAKGVGGAGPIPIKILSDVLGAGSSTLLRAMGMPGAAASMAQWSRVLTRVIREGKTPASIGALVVATKGLENTLGEKLDIGKLTAALNPVGSAQAGTRSIADINKPLPEEEEARRRIRERIEGFR
jgi:hypothetical protein